MFFFAAGVLRKRKALRAQYDVHRGKNAANTSVLGMLAKSIDACDNLFRSTSLRSMLYKEQKCCEYQCFGHDRQRQ